MLSHRAGAPASAESSPPNKARAENGNILQTLAPQQTVVPMIVAIILIRIPSRVGLGEIIAAGAGFRRIGGDDHSILIEVESDVALEVNGVTQIGARGETHGTSAGKSRSLDRAIDRGSVDSLAIAHRPETSYIKNARALRSGGGLCLGPAEWQRSPRHPRA